MLAQKESKPCIWPLKKTAYLFIMFRMIAYWQQSVLQSYQLRTAFCTKYSKKEQQEAQHRKCQTKFIRFLAKVLAYPRCKQRKKTCSEDFLIFLIFFSKIAILTPYQRTIKTNVLLFMAGEFACGIYVATGFFNQTAQF